MRLLLKVPYCAGFWTPATMKDPHAQLAGIQKAPRHVGLALCEPLLGSGGLAFVAMPIAACNGARTITCIGLNRFAVVTRGKFWCHHLIFLQS
jgi:hypothetical protein